MTQPQPSSPTPVRPKSLRFAVTLNLFLPGAGQWYLGQPTAGTVYAVGFLGCFVTMVTLFLRAYGEYLRLATNGDILEGDNLDRIGRAFPARVFVALLIVALGIYLASLVHLGLSRRGRK